LKELRQLAALLTRSERWAAAGLLGLALLGAFAEAVGIGAVFPLLSLLSQPEAMLADERVRSVIAWTGAASYEQFVLLATAVLMLVFVVKNVFLGALYYAQTRFVCLAEARIGTDLLSSYLLAPYGERVEHNSADRIRVVTTEVSKVTLGFLMPLIALVTEGLVVASLIGLLLAVRPQAAVLAFVLMGSMSVIVQAGFRRRLGAHRHVRVEASSAMFRSVAEGLGALKETKVLGREEHFVRRFRDNSLRYARSTIVFMTMNLLPRLLMETAAVATLAACIIVTIVTRQPLDTIVPVLTVFGLAAVRIMPSATRMLSAINNLRYYAPALRDVSAHVADAPRPAATSPGAPDAAAEPLETFELHEVSFSYPDEPVPTLRSVSLRIARGEIVALTGRSGSGKTTLSDIMLGLVAPTTGEVRINGRPLCEPRRELGTYAGLVPQNFFILDDTVRRNVAFGVPPEEGDDARVWAALDQARLAERVRADPRGLDMAAGENGELLSGGERQRLAIARALYPQPGLLVFDEATSALDATTESEIVETILTVSRTRAVLVIAHRPAILGVATRTYRIEDGILSEAPVADPARA
jgi:ABC-type multidrug transport system fused ATPase/permease subunit